MGDTARLAALEEAEHLGERVHALEARLARAATPAEREATAAALAEARAAYAASPVEREARAAALRAEAEVLEAAGHRGIAARLRAFAEEVRTGRRGAEVQGALASAPPAAQGAGRARVQLHADKATANEDLLVFLAGEAEQARALGRASEDALYQGGWLGLLSVEPPRPTVKVRSDGIIEVSVPATPWARHQSLNTPDIGGSGKVRPAEAAVAAQLEPVVGKMERYVGPRGTSKKSPDFVIVEGPNRGKTVDMMFTTTDGGAKEIEGLNRFFEKNMTVARCGETIPPLVIQVQEHLLKADVLVLDLRLLIPKNREKLMNYISTMPTEQRRRLAFIL